MYYDLYVVVMILICLLFKTDVYHESYVDLKFWDPWLCCSYLIILWVLGKTKAGFGFVACDLGGVAPFLCTFAQPKATSQPSLFTGLEVEDNLPTVQSWWLGFDQRAHVNSDLFYIFFHLSHLSDLLTNWCHMYTCHTILHVFVSFF